MCNTNKPEQNWFIGTIEIDGYSIPVVGRGVTKKDAEQEAFQRVVDVWSNCLELDGKLDLDLLDWWPMSVSD
jgi:hypothetical protein